MNRLLLAAAAGLFVLAPLSAGDTPEARKATIDFVRNLQRPDGGFLAQPPDPKSNRPPISTLRATSAAVRAFKYLAGDMKDREKCKEFVASCFDKDSGGFRDTPKGQPDVFTTAVGIMAVTELGMPAEPYNAGVVKYLAEHTKTFDEVRIAVAGLERIQAKSPRAAEWLAVVDKLWTDGGIVKGKNGDIARGTASVAVTALRLGAKLKNPEAVAKALKDNQHRSGGWAKDEDEPADLETTYCVMRCFMMLKDRPADVDGLRNFIAKCRNNDGGYSVTPNDPSSIGGTYFAAIVAHWLDAKK